MQQISLVTAHEAPIFPMKVAGELEREESQAGTESNLHQVIELQHPEGVYYKARVAEKATSDVLQSERQSYDSQHMKLKPFEKTSGTVKAEKHEVKCTLMLIVHTLK